jgi:hypothetical protein
MIVKFEVYQDKAYWCARGLGVSIFTQGKTYQKLLANIKEAALLHFEEEVQKGEKLSVLLLSEMEIGSAA